MATAMASRSLLGEGRGRQRTLEKLRVELDITCDLTRAHVETEEDLDCRVALDAGEMSPERLERATRLLPFRLSPDERNHILVKASAKWSLTSNAREHRRVLRSARRRRRPAVAEWVSPSATSLAAPTIERESARTRWPP